LPPSFAVQALRGRPSCLKADRKISDGKAASPQAPKVGHSRLVPPIPKAAVRDAKIKNFASTGRHNLPVD